MPGRVDHVVNCDFPLYAMEDLGHPPGFADGLLMSRGLDMPGRVDHVVTFDCHKMQLGGTEYNDTIRVAPGAWTCRGGWITSSTSTFR